MPITVDASRLERPAAPAKRRILETADRLFSDVGIRNVGVDRLIGEAQVTKATFYKHFRSKDRVILAYLDLRHDRMVERIAEHASSGRAADAIDGVLRDIVDDVQSHGFRGCPFLNAAAEFPEPDHPVRAAVREHRDWFTGALADLLRDAGHPMPGDGADELQLARDGALSGGAAGDPVAAASAVTRAFERVLAETRG